MRLILTIMVHTIWTSMGAPLGVVFLFDGTNVNYELVKQSWFWVGTGSMHREIPCWTGWRREHERPRKTCGLIRLHTAVDLSQGEARAITRLVGPGAVGCRNRRRGGVSWSAIIGITRTELRCIFFALSSHRQSKKPHIPSSRLPELQPGWPT
jgi:hypothetical protein